MKRQFRAFIGSFLQHFLYLFLFVVRRVSFIFTDKVADPTGYLLVFDLTTVPMYICEKNVFHHGISYKIVLILFFDGKEERIFRMCISNDTGNDQVGWLLWEIMKQVWPLQW